MAANQGQGQRTPLPTTEALASLPQDGGDRFNRLVFESSPYLRQHAANPVNWYPWGEAAFTTAHQEDKPIFLSIGYATCHWCHVMEHESFEDAAVAEQMNRHFVCIKVDKEERPDIDDIYMAACLAINGHGGWPLTVLLTPDRRPFFAGTYFPKNSRQGRIGMLELLPRLAQLWQDQRDELLENAQHLTRHLRASNRSRPGDDLKPEILTKARETLASQYDDDCGGFGTAPKFPTPHYYNFLVRHAHLERHQPTMEMVIQSLLKMRRGGIYDHLGFGFHRYSTDPQWLLPHFEKMLYDQALLAYAYLEAFQATQRAEFATTAHEIFRCVLRDMTAPEGGFYSAEDADSEGEEGKFYVWRREEIMAILGSEDGARFCHVFNCTDKGNFREESTGHHTGDNILHRRRGWQELADTLSMTKASLQTWFESMRVKLFEVREDREHPFKDDKILTDWNGLMIAALAYGSRVLQQPSLRKAAKRAFQFLMTHCSREDGRLVKRYRAGQAGLPAHLDDYAFTIWGALSLYDATLDAEYLAQARRLTRQAVTEFWDETTGAFYFTAVDSEAQIVRSMGLYDGAAPSGNSVMVGNLIRLTSLTGEHRYREQATAVVKAFAGQIAQQPTTACFLLGCLPLLWDGGLEVVIVGPPERKDTQALVDEVWRSYRPDVSMLLKNPDDDQLDILAPFTQPHQMVDGKATAYVCRSFSCQAPVTSIADLRDALT